MGENGGGEKVRDKDQMSNEDFRKLHIHANNVITYNTLISVNTLVVQVLQKQSGIHELAETVTKETDSIATL